MASKQKNQPRKSSDFLVKLGISLPDSGSDVGDDDDDLDEDLESELQLLLSGKSDKAPVKRAKKDANIENLDKMVAECMRNPSIDEGDDDILEDDALLNELHSLTKGENSPSDVNIDDNDSYKNNSELSGDLNKLPVLSMLQDRLNLYKQAEAASKNIGDASKTRRFGRAIKTLEKLISSAKDGYPINEDDIPPEVPIPKSKDAVSENYSINTSDSTIPAVIPQRLAPQPPTSKDSFMPERSQILSQDSSKPDSVPPPPVPKRSTSQINKPEEHIESMQDKTMTELITRRNQYKISALTAKKCGDMDTAINFVKIAKKFDIVIEAYKNGESIDLSDMPPPPAENSAALSNQSPEFVTSETLQTQSNSNAEYVTDVEAAALAAANEPEDRNMFNAPEPPTSILEALEQRLQKYCATRDDAKNAGNNGKARRLQRIVQQYEEAIKRHKAGQVVLYEELPTPPGFAPIPFENEKSELNLKPSHKPPAPLPVANVPVKANQPQPKEIHKPVKGKHPKIQRTGTLTILEKQLNYLLERQKLFRQAALESKKNGDIQQAKHYLSMSKGFDSMIEATKCGLPIDASTIPTPPQLESDFIIINESDCSEDKQGVELYPSLVEQLRHQIEMCTRNKEHFMCLGDVSSASKFEKLCLETQKDLALIQYSWENGEQIPRFHYETRLFSLVQCNTDLADNEIEVIVERGVNLPGKPDDLDAYIKIEFPIPQDAPSKVKTRTVKDTNNPNFHESFKFSINRKSRSQLRQFKRQAVKLEVWSKGGFFRSDFIIGTVMVKLLDLETKCTIHNSYDLLDGRKICGGKLEVKLRIRDPLLSKQVEEVREKWLVIDS